MWLAGSDLSKALDEAARRELSALRPSVFSPGTVLFRPGDPPGGFVIVLSGRVGVYLTGRSGRELLLYSVDPGEACIQTTMGLLSGDVYTGEGVTEADVSAVIVPAAMFERLMRDSPSFRGIVFKALGDRFSDVTRLLEQLAFVRVEQRLAEALVANAGTGDVVTQTHQELATQIGSAREVVSRKLERLARAGILRLDRGRIEIADRSGLSVLAKPDTG